MSAARAPAADHGVKRKDPPSTGEEKVQRLDIHDFQSVLRAHRVQHGGTWYYPVCLGYRIMQERGIHVTCSTLEQERMSRFSHRFCISRDARVLSTRVSRTSTKYRIITFGKQGNYLRRTLNCKGTWGVQLHRLVMLTFEPIMCPERFQVDHVVKSDGTHHFDGVGTYSNRLEHLRWLTHKQNSQRKNCKKHKSRVIGLKPVTAIHLVSGVRTDFTSVAEACKQLKERHPGLEFNCGNVSGNCYGRCNPIHGYTFVFQDASIQGEVWKPVPNSDWHVSNYGRVKGKYGQIHKGHASNQSKSGLQYRRVHMTLKTPVQVFNRNTKTSMLRKKVKFYIHNLVFQAFNGDLKDGMVVDHYDGFGHHNCASNLRLISQSENARHRGRSECASGRMKPVCECGFVRTV